MSQALFVIIFILFNSLARPNVSKLPLVTGSLMEENSIYNAEGGFLFLSFNGFLGDGGDSNPKAILTKLKSSTLCLSDTNTPMGD